MISKTKRLEQYFEDNSFYIHALTHKSWVNEHPKQRTSNERLEFLGDAVLEFVVSKEIFNKLQDKEEGYLTALRANLVNTINLASIALKLNIGENLFLSKGEEESGGRSNPSILANTVEAVIGALYLEGGIEKAETFIQENFLNELEEKLAQPLKDAKSRLQEHVQSLGFTAPKYEVVDETGPDHSKVFTLKVVVNDKTWGSGEGKNKSEAAQKAAEDALNNIKK